TISVSLNATTTIAATATDPGSLNSSCSAPISYRHDNIAPSPPTITGTTPSSPSNNTMPRVTGSAEPNSTVSIYINGSCSGSPAASAVTLSGTFNIIVAVPANTTTTITATATDQAGNSSTCSNAFFYKNDTIPP